MAPKSTVRGFQFSGVVSGIKKNRKKDLGLIYCTVPARAVGFFTSNRVQAAPVLQGRDVMRRGKLRAVLANSGNANSVTGRQGLRDSYLSARELARALGVSEREILVSSTGKIGEPLPMKRILAGIPIAVQELRESGCKHFSEAIRTTDAFPKACYRQGRIGGKKYSLLGIAKGAGMIEPHMATMLSYVVTDLQLPLGLMREAFRQAVGESFNSIVVDGDQSTNDTALFLSSGLSPASLSSVKSQGYPAFRKLLHEVCQTLALMMVQDGEGATKVVEIVVRGAKNDASARRIAYTVARSPLVKTSFFGEDPNWGRVFAAVGYSGEDLKPAKVDIYYGPVPLVRSGRPTGILFEKRAHQVMKRPRFTVRVELKQGRGLARVFTSDLTYDYVKINAEYRT
jgi:glutamate N-acetyltransferase/amino-acid N-acetyltransferase